LVRDQSGGCASRGTAANHQHVALVRIGHCSVIGDSGATCNPQQFGARGVAAQVLLIAAERQEINQLFRNGKLNDEARLRIERELDLREAGLANQRAEE
jgi:monovalent cation/hydrogen antiporter